MESGFHLRFYSSVVNRIQTREGPYPSASVELLWICAVVHMKAVSGTVCNWWLVYYRSERGFCMLLNQCRAGVPGQVRTTFHWWLHLYATSTSQSISIYSLRASIKTGMLFCEGFRNFERVHRTIPPPLQKSVNKKNLKQPLFFKCGSFKIFSFALIFKNCHTVYLQYQVTDETKCGFKMENWNTRGWIALEIFTEISVDSDFLLKFFVSWLQFFPPGAFLLCCENYNVM